MEMKVFACYNKDESVRMNSSSGGIFYIVAKKVIENGGIVYGAAFTTNWEVRHKACDAVNDLHTLMQSKYVQSDIADTYREAKEQLDLGKQVLFCGTPCQINGLISYLEITSYGNTVYENLLTMDFICHGVPSRMIWRKYLFEISKGRKITNINFRDKTNGWQNFGISIEYAENCEYLKSHGKDPYVLGFLKNLYLRESCYECNFKGLHRISDITMADFWGVHDFLPEIYDDKGTSLIMVHTEKGMNIVKALQKELYLCEISDEIVGETNSAAVKSVDRNPKRDVFFSEVKSMNKITRQINKYVKPMKLNIIKRVARKLYRIIKGK